MLYLSEREIGFDAGEIGFPSIDNCRAIVLVTAGGLFGYHLFGVLSQTKINTFVNFVNTHAHGNLKRRLYAASYGPGPDEQRAEIRSIAQTPALHFAGPVYWANVALVAVGSAYVNYVGINHDTCALTARTWSDAADSILANKGPYAGGANRTRDAGAAPALMYTNISTAGLRAVYPTAI